MMRFICKILNRHWWRYHVKGISRTCILCGYKEYEDWENGTGEYGPENS